MEALSGVIALIFWMAIIYSAINSSKKKNPNSWSRTYQSPAEQQAERIRESAGKSSPAMTNVDLSSANPSSAFKAPPASSRPRTRAGYANAVDDYSNSNVSGLDKSLAADRSAKSLRDLAGFLGEDRKGDWMARQMKEEARIKMLSGILDLGAMHDASCDADNLRFEHRKVHSNAIDTGERTVSRKKRQYR